MHRSLASLLITVLLMLGLVPAVSAQDATPAAAPFEGLDLPGLNVTVTETGFEGIPAELEAGRYVVTLSTDMEMAGVQFVQPVGMTADDFFTAIAGLGGPPPEAATPAAEIAPEAATPAEGEGGEGAGIPPFFYDFVMAGGAYAMADTPGQVILDLTPGEWIAWAEDPSAPQEPAVFTVTGEMPTDLVEPDTSATVIMGEYLIEVSEGELVAGQQVIELQNPGAQPHFIEIVKGPDGMTEADIEGLLQMEMAAMGMGGTPTVQTDLSFEDIMPVTFTATQSTGTTMWLPVTLEPGTYAMLCWFPDLGDGAPHAVHGMYTVVEVGE